MLYVYALITIFLIAIIVKWCHFYRYCSHLYAIYNCVWVILYVVSLPYSKLQARKTFCFSSRYCCGVIHCDCFSFSTECCVYGMLCAYTSMTQKFTEKRKKKKTLVHRNTVYLVFINPYNEYKLLIEVFRWFIGNVKYFLDYYTGCFSCLLFIIVCYILLMFACS